MAEERKSMWRGRWYGLSREFYSAGATCADLVENRRLRKELLKKQEKQGGRAGRDNERRERWTVKEK